MTAPRPPVDLADRRPERVTLPAGARMHRFFTAAYDPIYFDASRAGRLNAPDGRYGVLYAAQDIAGAFAETFLRSPGKNLIAPDLLKAKAYAELEAADPLQFVKLAGRGLARLGATAEVTHGGLPYDVPQDWSSKVFDAFPDAAGIAYNARHDDEALCYAVFDRAAKSIRLARTEATLDANWFWEIAENYDVGLAPS